MADRQKIMSMLGPDAKPEEKYLAEFVAPSTFEPPDEARNGTEWEQMVSMKMKPDGKTVCITKIGGIEGDEGEEMEVEEEEIPDSTMTERMMSGGY